jgi:glutamate--cysteine ligase
MLGTPALMKGLLYDDDCLEAGWDVVRTWSIEERLEAVESAARHGLDARVHRHRMRDFSVELVRIAREGLRRQAQRSSAGKDESVYLDALELDVEDGVSPADRVLRAWHEGGDAVSSVVSHAAYRAP